MTDAAHLYLSGVSLTLGERLVLEGVDLTARRGEVLVVLGPSGCGKTSLLRLIAGLIAPDQGLVLIEGASPVPGEATAMVFQSYRLLPWKTVRGNLAFALPHLPPPERTVRVEAALALEGLAIPQGVVATSSLLVMVALLAQSDAVAPTGHEVNALLCDPPVSAGFTILTTSTPIELPFYHILSPRGRTLSRAALRLRTLVQAEMGQ